MAKTSAINSGEDVYREVRIGFIKQGDSFTAWCKREDVNPTNARAALIGLWKGPRGRAMRNRVLKASGVALHQHRAA